MRVIRSLLARILLASIGTLLLSFMAFMAVFILISMPAIEGLVRPFYVMQLQDAILRFDEGGALALAAYVDRLDATATARHYVTDAAGRDLRDGSDRGPLLAQAGTNARPGAGHLVLTQLSDDGRHRLIAVFLPPPIGVAQFLPYFVVILGAVAFLCWWLAVSIASPLRDLAAAADRFGRGQLTGGTSHSRRGDEVGNLARSFEGMASRIQALLTAERRLLQDISHELRSPLARLTVAIALFRTSANREVAATRLQKEVDRLTRLVEALLELTRAERDPSEVAGDSVDIWAVLKDTAESCDIEAAARGSRLIVRGRGGATISGQPELLRRAFENVIRNAIRYAPSGTSVEVDLEARVGCSVVSIRDFGPGVPVDDLPRLATPFFRTEAARDQATGGVGLGLSIARRAVTVHHGSFCAENAQPGLRVRMSFPSRAQSAEPADAQEAEVSPRL